MFKKFANNLSLKSESFNPSLQKIVNPENLGYGLRFVTLDLNQMKLTFMGYSKPTIDCSIPLDDILRATTPQMTINIIKNIKKTDERRRLSTSIDGDSLIENQMIAGYKKDINFYPFHIVLKKGGRLEMLACELNHLREWVASVNTLIQNRKFLFNLRNKIDVQIL